MWWQMFGKHVFALPVLPEVCKWGISTTCAVHIEDCKGWWVSCGHSSVPPQTRSPGIASSQFSLYEQTFMHPSFVVMWTICHLFFCTDLEFVKTFLYTYQSFATPEKLLKKLIERYNVVRPERMPFQEFTMLRQTIQARVINALRLWVDLSVDFKGISVNVGLFLYVCVSVCVICMYLK